MSFVLSMTPTIQCPRYNVPEVRCIVGGWWRWDYTNMAIIEYREIIEWVMHQIIKDMSKEPQEPHKERFSVS